MNENGPRTDDGPGEPARAPDSDVLRLLASRERRRIVSLLRGEERTVEELATLLVGWTVADSGTVGNPADRERTLLRLVHVHLPKLADAGLVAYDREAGTVGPASIDPVVADYVEYGIDGGP